MLNLCKTAPFLLAIFILTGCPTPPKPRAKITPVEIPKAVPEPALKIKDILTETNQSAHPMVGPSPKPAATPAPQTNRVAELSPRQGWISWGSWSQMNGCGKPNRIKSNPHHAYELRSPSGIMTITVGSRVAYWNGLSLGLGFGPRLTNGEPFIHALDAVKNFGPLIHLPGSFPKTGRSVVIDPGHGGDNTGAKSVVNSRFEKDYTLDWALRIQLLLAAKGWKVYLTRTKDIDLSLSNRVAFADKVQADLFISLHFNSVETTATQPEHGGVETYCLTPAGMPSSLTRDFPDNPALVFPNNAFDAQNLQYAARLHRALIQFSGRRDRGLRRARFMTVLQGQKRPAVLLEGGYLSNHEEARLIASANYRQKLALAVATALFE